MAQIIWLSFLLCIASANNGTICLLNLDDIAWDDCSNEYFSTSFNILDNIDLDPILGSHTFVYNNEPRNTGGDLPGRSAEESHCDIPFNSLDLYNFAHLFSEDTNNVESTTGRAENSQLLLQELPGISAEIFQSSTSLDSLHFFDSIQLRRIEDANTEESKMKTDFATVQNSQLSLL
ncbi:hypothetical protein QQG55_3350 [Brugia pahangi]